MKNLIFSLAFMLIGSFAFASNSVEDSAELELEEMEVAATCTVTLEFGKSKTVITITCDCTQTEACDRAYKVARLAAVIADM